MTADVTSPAETPQGETIEAAIWALKANRPMLALRYLIEGTTPEALRVIMLVGGRNVR